jgi:hypothetical protein
MKLSEHVSAFALAGLLGVAAPFAVVAQAQAPAPAPQPAPQTVEITPAELDAFADAYEAVSEIEAEYTAQMQQTTDQSELMRLQQDAQARMSEAVEATDGMNVQRYVEILTVAQADPTLNAMIVERLQQ